jgi:hypothetical protein
MDCATNAKPTTHLLLVMSHGLDAYQLLESVH